MTSETIALLARENPVDEDELPVPGSAGPGALRDRIVFSDGSPALSQPATARRGPAAVDSRPRRLVVRVAVVGAAVALLAIGVLSVLPGNPGKSLVEPASAADAAIAVLSGTPGSIVHADLTVRQRNADGSVVVWRSESWQETTPPYDRRELRVGHDGVRTETATVDGTLQVYDPATNTVEIHDTGPQQNEAAPPAGGTPPPATAQPFRDQVLSLLRAGKLQASARAVIDGREAIAFSWNDGHTTSTYTVDARTYDPIQWKLGANGSTAETTMTFETYELLPADEELLDLTVQHQRAKVSQRDTN